MVWLLDCEKMLKICLFVSTECTNVTDGRTDRQTDGRTPRDGIGRAYAKHRATKMFDCCLIFQNLDYNSIQDV